MNLSILCITNNEHPHVQRYILAMHRLATILGAELVLGLDRQKAQRAAWRGLATVAIDLEAKTLQEDVMDQAVDVCTGDYILRLDDDEMASTALKEWLISRKWAELNYNVYAFPRVYLWPDENHMLSNSGMYPDLQTRLGKKACMFGVNYVHAGNPNGTGLVIPYAIEHHNLLVKPEIMRRATLERYEGLRPGAGTRPEYARYNVPEMFYPELEYKEYNNGNFSTR